MKTKNILKLAMALLLVMMPSMMKAQGDLAAFDLKGKVKSCTWINHKAGCVQFGFMNDANKEVITFDATGKCKTWNGEAFAAGGRSGSAVHNEVTRDAKRRITYGSLYNAFYNPGSADEHFKYNAAGKLASHRYEDAGMTITTTFTYDAAGVMTASTSKLENLMDEKTTYKKVTYSVTAKDAKGNWTKRTAKLSTGKTWTETRTILYY